MFKSAEEPFCSTCSHRESTKHCQKSFDVGVKGRILGSVEERVEGSDDMPWFFSLIFHFVWTSLLRDGRSTAYCSPSFITAFLQYQDSLSPRLTALSTNLARLFSGGY